MIAASLSWLLAGDPTALETWLATLISPAPIAPPESHAVSTLRDLIAAKSTTAATLTTANQKLADDLKLLTDDQAAVSTAISADGDAAKAVAAGITAQSPVAGEAIDPNPNPDGTMTVYKTDSSPQLYHTYTIPTLDSPLPEVAPPVVQPPVEVLPVEAPPA